MNKIKIENYFTVHEKYINPWTNNKIVKNTLFPTNYTESGNKLLISTIFSSFPVLPVQYIRF